MKWKLGFESDRPSWKFLDDTFLFTEAPAYSRGYISKSGYEGQALALRLGGRDSSDIEGMSASWRKTFKLEEASDVTLTLRYKMKQDRDFDRDEFSKVLAAIDGDLIERNGKDYLARLTGDGNGGKNKNTGWKKATLDLGELDAGKHKLDLGGYVNKKTSKSEHVRIFFDEVEIVAKPVEPDLAAFEAEVLKLTNEFRKENDRAPLRNDADLNAAAENWSRKMAKQDFFEHSTSAQAEKYGYDVARWGENIAAGYRTPEDVVEGWINSSGHRKNLLNRDFQEIGIGYYKMSNDGGDAPYTHYWTQVFGTEPGESPL